MKKEVFVFVRRYMEGGYGNAYPVCTRWFLRWCDKVLVPRAKAELKRIAEQDEEECGRRLEHVSIVAKRYVYSMKCPDTKSEDPLAVDRKPEFEMQVVFDGKPDVLCKAFDDCLDECRRRAWNTMVAGADPSLRFPAPAEMYLD
jgi:hypothetical protein